MNFVLNSWFPQQKSLKYDLWKQCFLKVCFFTFSHAFFSSFSGILENAKKIFSIFLFSKYFRKCQSLDLWLYSTQHSTQQQTLNTPQDKVECVKFRAFCHGGFQRSSRVWYTQCRQNGFFKVKLQPLSTFHRFWLFVLSQVMNMVISSMLVVAVICWGEFVEGWQTLGWGSIAVSTFVIRWHGTPSFNNISFTSINWLRGVHARFRLITLMLFSKISDFISIIADEAKLLDVIRLSWLVFEVASESNYEIANVRFWLKIFQQFNDAAELWVGLFDEWNVVRVVTDSSERPVIRVSVVVSEIVEIIGGGSCNFFADAVVLVFWPLLNETRHEIFHETRNQSLCSTHGCVRNFLGSGVGEPCILEETAA